MKTPRLLPTLALIAAALPALPVPASPQIAAKAGCATCHAVDRKLVGPSYKEIAAKYRSDAGAAAKLAEATRKGSKGTWGPLPMPPTDAAKIGDADLKAVIAWILKTP